MTNYYKISLIKSNCTLKIGYRKGVFLKLEKLSGKLSIDQISSIGKIIPPTEIEISNFKAKFIDKIMYAPILTKKSLYSQFNDAWFSFYYDFMGVKPRFNKIDGYNLKQIIAYLTDMTQNEKEALAIWQMILQKWHNIDDFHKKNTDLKYINSKINIILNNVKRVNNKGASNVDADYLKEVIDELHAS